MVYPVWRLVYSPYVMLVMFITSADCPALAVSDHGLLSIGRSKDFVNKSLTVNQDHQQG